MKTFSQLQHDLADRLEEDAIEQLKMRHKREKEQLQQRQKQQVAAAKERQKKEVERVQEELIAAEYLMEIYESVEDIDEIAGVLARAAGAAAKVAGRASKVGAKYGGKAGKYLAKKGAKLTKKVAKKAKHVAKELGAAARDELLKRGTHVDLSGTRNESVTDAISSGSFQKLLRHGLVEKSEIVRLNVALKKIDNGEFLNLYERELVFNILEKLILFIEEDPIIYTRVNQSVIRHFGL
jgi:hypothetical protein